MGLFSKSPSPSIEADMATQVEAAATSLAAAEVALARLKSDLADEQNDLALGYVDAQPRIPLLQADVEAQERCVAEGRARKQVLEEKLAQEQSRRKEADDRLRQQSVPGLADRQLELARRLEKQTAELGDTMREMHANGVRLADALQSAESRRLFGVGALTERIRGTSYSSFTLERPASPGLVAYSGKPSPYHFLDYPIAPASPLVRSSMSSEEQRVLDAVVRVFASKSSAEAARRRIDPSGERLHVLPGQHGLFHLVEGRRRGGAAKQRPQALSDGHETAA